MTEPTDDKEKSWRDSLPFPAHWLVYAGLKLLLLVLVVGFALKWKGLI
jgi:hypothetical protein